MHLSQALREPDADKFRDEMQKELHDHASRGHWTIVLRSSLPSHTTVLPAVWSMRRKQRIDTRKVYRWKARLTIHGGRQTYGVNYWETYSPVVRWSSIRLILILTLKYHWKTRQLDFVLAYPQAPVECDLYMEIPYGHTPLPGPNCDYALKLERNLYGQKQAGRIWYQYLTSKLLKTTFTQSKHDKCMFYYNDCIILIYVDNTIIAGPSTPHIDHVIKTLSSLFDVEDQGNLSNYLGIKIKHLPNHCICLTQPHLIDSILQDLHFQANTKPTETPALLTTILQPNFHGCTFSQPWSYRSIVGKLNFLEKSTRPNIAYAVHQCACFSSQPKASHGDAIKRITRYLLGTKTKGIILSPGNHSFACWADADFVGNWNATIAMEDMTTARSRSGYIITYASCPIIWASKLQTEIALSTTKAEYISLSIALRETIPLIDICKELRSYIQPRHHLHPQRLLQRI